FVQHCRIIHISGVHFVSCEECGAVQRVKGPKPVVSELHRVDVVAGLILHIVGGDMVVSGCEPQVSTIYGRNKQPATQEANVLYSDGKQHPVGVSTYEEQTEHSKNATHHTGIRGEHLD